MTTRQRLFLALPTALAAAALTVAPAVAATPSIGGAASALEAAPAPATQGIIMSDGRICNPRWGC